MEGWGKCALINLTDCNPDAIRSADIILLWGQSRAIWPTVF